MTELIMLTAALFLASWAGYELGYTRGKYSEINRRNTRPETAEDAARMTP